MKRVFWLFFSVRAWLCIQTSFYKGTVCFLTAQQHQIHLPCVLMGCVSAYSYAAHIQPLLDSTHLEHLYAIFVLPPIHVYSVIYAPSKCVYCLIDAETVFRCVFIPKFHQATGRVWMRDCSPIDPGNWHAIIVYISLV